MAELDRRGCTLAANKVGDAAPRRGLSRGMMPAPPIANLPRCTRCQSVGAPSAARYCDIGETTMRLRTVNPRTVTGRNITGMPGATSSGCGVIMVGLREGDCVYRKLKSDHSGDEVRPEWRVN